MSTNGLSSWAVDLKDVGAIYPFQGTEVLLVILGVIFWVGWHILQLRHESAEIDSEMKSDQRGEMAKSLIERY